MREPYSDPERTTESHEDDRVGGYGGYSGGSDLGEATRTCPTCSRTIPADREQCEDCLQEGLETNQSYRSTISSSSSHDSEDKVSYGRVVFAVVPAPIPAIAEARGTAAFNAPDSFVEDPSVTASDVRPFHAFGSTPASSLTMEWEGVTGPVTYTSETGQQVVDTALAKTAQADQPHLYDTFGNALTDAQALEAHVEDLDKQAWLVPGVVRRYTVSLPDGPREILGCRCAETATPRVYVGRGGAPNPYDEPQRPIWRCTRCVRPRYGPEPDFGEESGCPEGMMPGPDGDCVPVPDAFKERNPPVEEAEQQRGVTYRGPDIR